MKVSSREKALVYGVTAMSISLLHSFFVSFYIDFYVRGRMSDSEGFALGGFALGQAIYAIWNSLNDLGFGWMGDTSFANVSRRRFSRIAIGGPLWALVFGLMWMPFDLPFVPPIVQFTLSLVLYDGFFSFTTVAFRALLTDITTDPRERELCNSYAAVFHLIGSLGVGAASYVYESDSAEIREAKNHAAGGTPFATFRGFAFLTAVLAALGFWMSSWSRYREVKLHEGADEDDSAALMASPTDNDSPASPKPQSLTAFAKETCGRPAMGVALVMWALQEYSCTFATNFFGLFLAAVTANEISPLGRSFVLQLSFALPHIGTLLLTPIVAKRGAKSVIGTLFRVRLVLCVLLMAIYATSFRTADGYSRNAALMFAVALLGNRVLTESVCRLQPILLSDLVDEDTMVFQRTVSRSAAINGLTSLASKPCQSLAPVISCAFLASYTTLMDGAQKAAASPAAGQRGTVPAAAAGSIVWLVAATGIATSGLLTAIWPRYPLSGSRLSTVRRYMEWRSSKTQAL